MAGRTTQSRGKTKADMALPTLIELFILSKQIEGRSPKTLSWYQANLERFAGFMTNGHAPTLHDITLDEARAFVAHLQGKTTRFDDHHMRPTKEGGLSPHSVHAYVRTLKTFGSWLVEEGYVEVHPFERLKAPKLPETMIEVLSDDEIGGWWPPSASTRCWARVACDRTLAVGHRLASFGAMRADDGKHPSGRGLREGAGQGGEGADRTFLQYYKEVAPAVCAHLSP